MRFRTAASRRAAFVLTCGTSSALCGSLLIFAGQGCGQGFATNAAGANGDSAVGMTGNGGDGTTPVGATDSAADGPGVTGDDDGPSPPAEIDGSVADGGDPFGAFLFPNDCSGQGTLADSKCHFAFAPSIGAKIGGVVYGDDNLYIRFTLGTSDTYIGRVSVDGGDVAAVRVPNVKQLTRNGDQVYWATEADAATGFEVSRFDIATHAVTTPIVFTEPITNTVDIRPKGDGVAAYGLQARDAGVYVATEVDTATNDGGATAPVSSCVVAGLEAGTTDVSLHVDLHAAYILGHVGTGIPSAMVECLDDGGSAVLGTTSGRVVGAVSVTQSSDQQTVYATWSAGGKIYVETYATGVSAKNPKTSASFSSADSEALGGARVVNVGTTDTLYLLTSGPMGQLAKLVPPVLDSGTFAPTIKTGITSGGPFAAPAGRGLSSTQLLYFAGGNVLWKSTVSLASP